MSRSALTACVIGLVVLLASVTDARADRRVHPMFRKNNKTEDSQKAKSSSKLKPFEELTKDKVAIEGLFTFYHDTTDNSVLMAVKPEQFGPYYLCGMARATGDGTFYDTGPPGRSFPFYFKRVGENILILEKNLRLRADTSSTMYNAVRDGISDNLFASAKVMSQPQDSTEAILINAEDLFVRDAENTSYFLGQRAKTGISFDGKHSYFARLKSFPNNSEIDVMLHFKSSKPQRGVTLQNGEDFYHTYHYSLSAIPETDYVPRLADDRIGHFVTMYRDYSRLDTESPYVRYIDRWHLEKADPDAALSEPVEPIVFWVDNKVPLEYRDAIAEGIEFWNQSFEKIGFKNAIVAKQMPDTASWDPLDVRYSTVQWMVSPRVYAIGPSRANPFTGQIYDADISVSADFVRAMYIGVDNFIRPVSYDGRTAEEPEVFNPGDVNDLDRVCTYGDELAQEAAFGLAYLLSVQDNVIDKDSLTREYVHSYLREVVAHEVGHCLGFRHNFKASSIYNLDQLQSREFTKQNGTVGTIMDYAPANISAKGEPQGEFFASTPGPYDDWLIEYAYSEFGADSPEDEADELEAIASRSADPRLAYATDFDRGAFAVDPLVNVFDLGTDPIAFCRHRLDLTAELWNNAISEFEKPGTSYEKIRRVFAAGWRPYLESAIFASRYVGGLYHSKNWIGDKDGHLPFRPVPAAEQRRAIAFLRDNIFAADAFDFPADLMNKLQPRRGVDFTGSMYRSMIDYPIHERVLSVQRIALSNLYNPVMLGRMRNNLERYNTAEDVYTMYDMFTEVRRAIWGEITGPANINSYRRQLQLAHLQQIIDIYLSPEAQYPNDARTLAANDLDVLEGAASRAVGSSAINGMTRAHLKEVLRQIKAAKDADREFTGMMPQK